MDSALSLFGVIQMSHSYQDILSHGTCALCKRTHSEQGVHRVPPAASQWNPKPQERNWLSAKLSPLGFPFGLYMECNSDYFQCFPFGYIHCSLNRGVQTPYMNYTYNIFHVYTVLNAWNRWQRSVVIQRVYLLSVSPETTPQSGLITVDSEPLHTYCVVTFLLR